jgi:hypothetical protein
MAKELAAEAAVPLRSISKRNAIEHMKWAGNIYPGH